MTGENNNAIQSLKELKDDATIWQLKDLNSNLKTHVTESTLHLK